MEMNPAPAALLLVNMEKESDPELGLWLEEAGYSVTLAAPGEECLTAVGMNRFGMIILNLDTPLATTNLGWLIKASADDLPPLLLIGTPEDRDSIPQHLPVRIADFCMRPLARHRLLHRIRHNLEHQSLKRRHSRSERTLEAVLSGVQEAILRVDAQGIIRGANESVFRLCPITPEDIDHTRLEDIPLCGPKLAGLIGHMSIDKESILDAELFCQEHPDPNLVVRVSIFPLPGEYPEDTGAIVVIRDRSTLAPLDLHRKKRTRFHRLVGVSATMQSVYTLIEDLAAMEATVLVTGESGTGKELVAEALHYEGVRAKGPLVKVNCSALPDALLESELFGHVKGAFTGAVKNRRGRFALADHGTIFLDEIGDISPRMQTRLLRTIQEKEYEPVGDSHTYKVDVRIISATNQDLKRQIADGSFREDLFYRLNVVEIKLPPLRQRREDIPLLTKHFLEKFNSKYAKNIHEVATEVIEVFETYRWPGNVRELENVIERAFAVCRKSVLRVKDLPKEFLLGSHDRDAAGLPPLPSPAPGHIPPLAAPSQPETAIPPEGGGEKESIIWALESTHWRKKEAAKLLGISRSSLYRKMELLGIQ
ncbi:MAG: sigma-54-dependent Fis family transcriptional regulator [Magnetococcales bacterium]|nr:sigma-54-dependent Fis family transcriptional regulator [Magnetococcales bacterium]